MENISRRRAKADQVGGQRFEQKERREAWYSIFDVGGGSVDEAAFDEMSANLRGAILEGTREKGGYDDGG